MSDDLAATLRALIERLDRLGLRYMIVGSIAALSHGRARATQDFDVVVALDPEGLDRLLDALPSDEFYVSRDAAVEALRSSRMFNVIDLRTGWKVDVVPLKSRAFSRREFERRRPVNLLGLEVQVASLEDVIRAKLEWSKLGGGSERQRDDARELLRLHRDRADRGYLEAGVQELGITEEWATVAGVLE